MSYLPKHEVLHIELLSGCFKDCTNSYKFYWFLAILDHLKDSNNDSVSFEDLSLRMISSVWYPLNYFKLSFGKQDSFKNIADIISTYLKIDNTPNSNTLFSQLESSLDLNTVKEIQIKTVSILKRYVAFRFLRSFFKIELLGAKDSLVDSKIKELANSNKSLVPYTFNDNGIIIHPLWREYFQLNQRFLRGFIHWHLVKFLHKHNPNVIGLSEKLEKPFERKLSVAKWYWGSYLKQYPTRCIYSNQLLTPINMSLDHFIPWSYIAHDQLWNIVPTTRSMNSSKSDNLPSLEAYFQSFAKLQFEALQFHLSSSKHNILSDFNSVLSTDRLCDIGFEEFYFKIESQMRNHVAFASNMGFTSNYVCT
ncbi:MAG: hypothetical protein JWN56_957 [Sphingobacteriales bacterium]|nr:hypothetical protein [Sphingobacteriales bacterium]